MSKSKVEKLRVNLVVFFSQLSESGYLPVVIYALAFIVRLLFILETNNELIFNSLMGDPLYYDSWAERIMNGEVAGKKVWEMSPLYPYMLALIYKVFGHDYLMVKFFQIIMGSTTCLLLFYIGERLFSRTVGLTAALIAVFAGPLIFYDGVIMKTTPGILMLTLFIYSLVLAQKGRLQDTGYFFAGVELGLLCLLRENALALVLIMLIILLRSCAENKMNREKALNLGLLFLLGLGLVILPVTYRNYKVGNDFVLITSKYGETFYEGNNPDADGTYSPPEFIRPDPHYEHADFTAKAEEITGSSLKPSQVANFWLWKGIKFMVRHPVKWTGILFKKARYLFNAYEGPDNYDYSFCRNYSILLRLPLIGFGILGPFSLMGMYFGFRKFRELYPLYIIVLFYTVSLLMFFIFSRFRVYMIPALSIFAAYGLVSAGKLLRKMELKKLIFPVTILAVFLVVFHLPVKKQPFTGSYNTLGCIYSKNLQYRKAIEAFEKAIELNGQMPALWFNLGNSYKDLAMESRSMKEPRQETDKLFNKAHRFHGIADFMFNRFEKALKEFESALEYWPEDSEAISYSGITCFYLEDYKNARDYLEKSLENDPGLSENRKALAMIYESYDNTRAISMWESYLREVPDTSENIQEKKLIIERIEGLKLK